MRVLLDVAPACAMPVCPLMNMHCVYTVLSPWFVEGQCMRAGLHAAARRHAGWGSAVYACSPQVLAGLAVERVPERLQPAARRLGAAARIEAAAAAHDAGSVAEAAGHLEAAEQLLGVRWEVTGASPLPLSSMLWLAPALAHGWAPRQGTRQGAIARCSRLAGCAHAAKRMSINVIHMICM